MPPPLLPTISTRESHTRLDVATDLIERCPAHLGRDIAVTGSVSRGLADRFSDIEIVCWDHSVPPEEARRVWLEAAGATEISNHPWDDIDGTRWHLCRFQGLWIEIGWNAFDRVEGILDDLLTARRCGHDSLQIAALICDAIPLRTSGRLRSWQERLSRYPPDLQARVIAVNTEVWADPHAPMVRWALAVRQALMPLATRLTWDMQNLWAILYAVNERWEQDYKWTSAEALDLPRQPDGLAERLNRVFTLDDPERSIREAFSLILDILALVPPKYDVAAARDSIARALRQADG